MNLLTLLLIFGELPRHIFFIYIFTTEDDKEEVRYRIHLILATAFAVLLRTIHSILIVVLFR